MKIVDDNYEYMREQSIILNIDFYEKYLYNLEQSGIYDKNDESLKLIRNIIRKQKLKNILEK